MIKLLPRFFVSILVLTAALNANGQGSRLRYRVEAGTILTESGKTPFWMRANQYGTVPLDGNFGALRVAVRKDYDSTRSEKGRLKEWGLGYGASMAVNASRNTELLIPEGYLKVRFKAFEFYVGRRKEVAGLIDTLLSSGSYSWSGNALPIPKVELSIPNYTSILGNGILSVKGNYAHGWFGKQQYTRNYYLHQKSLYAKLGRDNWTFNFYGGVNHQVQWGGYADHYKNDTLRSAYGYYAEDPFVYLVVALPLKWDLPPGKYSLSEELNQFGNHLGSVDIGFSIKAKFGNIYVYRQTPYEDGQLPEVFLSGDGNYTLSIDLKSTSVIKRINFGYLDTRRQGGELTGFARWVGKKETHGNETGDYFNHGQYWEGWSYNKNGIGTPLLIPNSDLSEEAQKDVTYFIEDNRVQSYYGAVTGKISMVTYVLQSSHLKSSGRFTRERIPPLKQFSSRLSLQFPLSKLKLEAKVDLAYDKGKLYGDNLGGSLFLIKKW